MPARFPRKFPSAPEAPPGIGSHGKRSGAWARHAFLFCASAILAAVAIYIMATCAFNTVVRCELEKGRVLQQPQSAMAKLAATNICSF
jgi:hypothetical protein